MGYSGQEQSRFVSSYVQAMKLLGTGEDATEGSQQFLGNLQTFASGHNVRRKALGATLDRAVEGTFTAHMSLPDDVVVAGNDSLRTLLGIRGDDEHGDAKFAEAVRMIESGSELLRSWHAPAGLGYVQPAGRANPSHHREDGTGDLRCRRLKTWAVRYAVSPTLAAVWRGDVDADRALLHGVTDVRYKGTTVDMPGGQETWYRAEFPSARPTRSLVLMANRP